MRDFELFSARIAAGGSLDRPVGVVRPGLLRRLWMLSEMGVLFIAMPLVMAWAIFDLRIPLFVVLQPVLVVMVLFLLWDDSFRLKRELARLPRLRDVALVLATFMLVGGLITAAVWWLYPNLFLSFPRRAPRVWMMVLVLYPLLSVLAQELVYRTFFFHRYGPMFGDNRALLILTNGLLFGFGHIIFGNIIAVAGTAVAGILFAYRYETTRSLWAVWLEHSLYGALIFTVGLGGYFFTGVSNVG